MRKTTSKSPDRVVTRDKLYYADLLGLLERKMLVLKIYPFITSTRCEEWAGRLECSTRMKRYSNAEDVPVKRIGMTLFETAQKPQKLKEYFACSAACFPNIEEILGAGENPIARIHEGISEVWPKPCRIERLKGQAMNPGIIRSFESSESGGLPPHIDTLLKDLPKAEVFHEMKTQLAANLYLKVAPQGGELEVWNDEPNQEALDELYSGQHDFMDRSKLPKQMQTIRPRVGELILFRSSCIHSVRPARGGTRTTASSFIGFYNKEKALTVWA